MVATIVCSVILALSYSGRSAGIPAINQPVPRFNIANVIPGAPGISEADLQGRAVVLNFWGSSCPPCRAEMPILQAAHRQLGDRVTFIGIDEQDSRSAAISFFHSVGVTYLSGFDGTGEAGNSFGIPGTPTTYYISHGRELGLTLGELTKTTLRMNVRQWFGLS